MNLVNILKLKRPLIEWEKELDVWLTDIDMKEHLTSYNKMDAFNKIFVSNIKRGWIRKHYDLYYSKITNRTAKLVGEIDTNLLSNKLIEDYANGYLFVNYINNRYYLNQVSEHPRNIPFPEIQGKYFWYKFDTCHSHNH